MVDINPSREEIARRTGNTPFVNPRTIDGDLVSHLNELAPSGADYTFEATGNVYLMCQAFDGAHFAYSTCTIIGIEPEADLLAIMPSRRRP